MKIKKDTPDPSVECDAHAASEGDLDALGRLYERYADRLHRFLTSRTRGNMHLADDVAGETWVRVAASIQGYTSVNGGFPAWLFTIARRQLADHYRCYTTKHEHISSELLDQVTEVRADVTPGPESYTLALETREQIAAAVESLPTSQRRAVILHHWVGLSLAETAAAMQKSPGAVAMLHQRALRRLDPALSGFSPRNLDAGTLVALGGSERATEPA